MKKNKLQLYWEHRYNIFLASKGVEGPRAELRLLLTDSDFVKEMIDTLPKELTKEKGLLEETDAED